MNFHWMNLVAAVKRKQIGCLEIYGLSLALLDVYLLGSQYVALLGEILEFTMTIYKTSFQ